MTEMQSKKLAGAKKALSVQQYLDIAAIRDNAALLKDGSLRAVLALSSINFALKSEAEQNALISAYAQFLNSLDHPVQIVIQSRRLNIDEYLGRLKSAEKEQANELLRLQIGEYLSFIKELTELGQIMAKRFYVVVPYSPISDKRKGFWVRLSELLTPFASFKLKTERLAGHLQALEQRVAHVESGLSSMGLKSQRLDTQALIELFYQAYNPDIAETQKLQDITKLRVEETVTI